MSGDNLQTCSSQVLQQELLSSPSSSQKDLMLQNSDEKDGQSSMVFIGTLKGLQALKGIYVFISLNKGPY